MINDVLADNQDRCSLILDCYIKNGILECRWQVLIDLEIGGHITRVVDLCAAPGSWSQVLSKRLWESQPEEERKNVSPHFILHLPYF